MRYLRANFGRITLTGLLFCLIVYTVYHAVGGSAGNLGTTPVRRVTDTAVVTGEAWLFRDETVLTAPGTGLVNCLAGSGTKVKKNTQLVSVWYPSGADAGTVAQTQRQLDAVNRQISLLEESLLPEGTKLSAASGYRDDAERTLSQIRAAIRSGNWSSVGEEADEVLISLSRYASLLSGEDGIRQTLAVLYGQRNAILTGESRTLVNDGESGYFYTRDEVDGLEGVFRTSELETLTSERLEQLKQTEPAKAADTVAGKICYQESYVWYLALTLPADIAGALKADTAYLVRFPENRDRELRLTCTGLRDAGNGQVLVILRSDVTPAGFSFLRAQTIGLTLGETSGLYIPEQALVSLGGQTGVYIFNSGTVEFRRIAILSERDGYVLCNEEDPDPEAERAYLKLNDLMVLSGKNLYDGKVYRQ